jgi:CHAT domain-containing protein
MGGTVLLDEAYTLENLDRTFATTDYRIVHMATHGVFGGSSDETFLLTHDDKLTMDRLEDLIGRTRRRGSQVDLLTLSACQTALGDEWAAFGLAGIAVKAGVSSAVATLWYADDEAAFEIMTDFYRRLRGAGDSKARALQQAQVRMIRDNRFDHPAFWAPFLLIGNWS